MAQRNWLKDFKYSNGTILIKKTGHVIENNWALWHSIFTWFSFYFLAQGWRFWRFLTGHRRPKVAFSPDKPRPWYFIWPVLAAAGAKMTSDVSEADIVFQFDDSTVSKNPVPTNLKKGARLVNFDCTDVSKSVVAAAWEKVAGYSLAVNPRSYSGPVVEKSEKNAAHDGRILEAPFQPAEDKTYQRLIDNEIDGGLVEDLRACIVGGRPAITLRKRRPLERRFLNENVEVLLDKPENCYSAEEIELISAFAAEIGMDWGGVDVLRDRQSGQIFIVDANKTDMGPPVAMKLGDKLKSTRRMAMAFMRAFAS